jgi:hypothetical protein
VRFVLLGENVLAQSKCFSANFQPYFKGKAWVATERQVEVGCYRRISELHAKYVACLKKLQIGTRNYSVTAACNVVFEAPRVATGRFSSIL